MTGVDLHSAEMKMAITEVFSTLSRMEAEPLRAWLAPEVVMDFPYAWGGIPERFSGRDAVIAGMGSISRTFASFEITPTAFFACPDKATTIVEASSQGVRLDGMPYANRYVTIFSFNDSKIILWREYFDPLKLGIDQPDGAEANR